jgi:hypothetical protein
MKAISLWQPWASLMAMGLKKIETRSWPTKYRGPLLIHAAKRKPTIDEIEHIDFWLHYYHKETDFLGGLEFGKILCQVDLIGCVRSEIYPVEGLELELGNYGHNRYLWITANLKTLKESIAYRGRQGLFEIPDELLKG